jgi:nucleoside-diphosphate-sugar epimerase
VPASLARLPGALDFVFYLASPGGAEDALYRSAYVDGQRNLYQALASQGQRPRRVLFASSTSV